MRADAGDDGADRRQRRGASPRARGNCGKDVLLPPRAAIEGKAGCALARSRIRYCDEYATLRAAYGSLSGTCGEYAAL